MEKNLGFRPKILVNGPITVQGNSVDQNGPTASPKSTDIRPIIRVWIGEDSRRFLEISEVL